MNISLEGFAMGYGIITTENYDQALIDLRQLQIRELEREE